jgi:hypothetical protein
VLVSRGLSRGMRVVLCVGGMLIAFAAPAAAASMPDPSQNFLGMGATNTASVETGDPPDPSGAVGPSNYVQAVNGGIEIWDKQGGVVSAAKLLKSLWSGYVGVNVGNGCASRNDGEPVVRYDRQADRWLVAQASIPHTTTGGGPSFECVAVSKSGDPTGAYWLYDFKFPYSVPVGLKVGVWPDGYYATFNAFDGPSSAFKGVDVCAWDRAAMLTGQAAAQQCKFMAFPSNPPACPAAQSFFAFGVLPATVDGSLLPPSGSPEYLVQFDQTQCSGPYNQLDVWQYHVDWGTPGNSTLTGPTPITVADFTPPCNNSATPNCIPQPGTTTIDALGDRLMDRLVYRNMGDHQSLLLNHTIHAGAGAGVRWYELRMPSGAVGATPSVYQQGTVAPSDTNWRWLGSLAEDQAGDIALGYSISSAAGSPGVSHPSIAWTGRLGTDTGSLGAMTQTEAIVDTGAASAYNDYGSSPGRSRWGEYSSMTVDPSDDCTFWYTNEVYKTTAFGGWDTYIASVKLPNCAANDFSIAPPTSVSAIQGGAGGTTTISTAQTAGSPETIALNAWDLPPGATASFSPSSITTGSSSTLTLTAGPSTPVGAYTVQIAGTAPSALHGMTVSFTVNAGHTLTVTKTTSGSGEVTSSPTGIDCGSTCAYEFAAGTPVTLTATPDQGALFVGWSGVSGCPGTGTCPLTMDSDQSVTATFDYPPSCSDVSGLSTPYATAVSVPLSCLDPDIADAISYAIVSGPAHGALGTIDQATGHVSYTPASNYSGPDSFTYKASDNHGVDSNTSTVTITVHGPVLSVKRAGSGSGSVSSSPGGIKCGTTCHAEFAYGMPVTLTATPAAGSRLVGWSGAGCSGTGTCQLTIAANRAVTAIFGLKPPDTQITAANIQSARRKATFTFKAIGRATGFQCALVKKPQTKPSFSRCSPPKTYKSLARGTYSFQVRAFNAGGADPTPAKRQFTIH